MPQPADTVRSMPIATRRHPGQLGLGICVWCGQTFLPVGHGRRSEYCAATCRRQAAKARANARGSAPPDQAELADALYALACAAADTRADLTESLDADDLRAALDWLLEHVAPLEALERKLRP